MSRLSAGAHGRLFANGSVPPTMDTAIIIIVALFERRSRLGLSSSGPFSGGPCHGRTFQRGLQIAKNDMRSNRVT